LPQLSGKRRAKRIKEENATWRHVAEKDFIDRCQYRVSLCDCSIPMSILPRALRFCFFPSDERAFALCSPRPSRFIRSSRRSNPSTPIIRDILRDEISSRLGISMDKPDHVRDFRTRFQTRPERNVLTSIRAKIDERAP